MGTTPVIPDTALRLAIKMASLGFVARYNRVDVGPVVSQYFFTPNPTSQLSKVLSRTEDLAMSVGAESVVIQRIRDEISIAVPNRDRSIISFDRCLHWLATSADTNKMALPLLMGQTPVGTNFTLDLAVQPHILIAGTTGSGKSVFTSQLITSLAVQKSPEELRFYLVDTKQLDLTLFASLPHVAETVDKIEDLHQVMGNLLKTVRRRTEKMKGVCRNIGEYNTLNPNNKLPYLVLIIDELADVIGQDKELAKDEDKDSRRVRISDSLKMLAQISRAVGVHIIAATQRPSVKVVDGDIKTNFPTRISFKLPTSADSRVVLDDNGAENLLGLGDYLYKTAQDSNLSRAHGSFVSMNDIAMVLAQHEMIRGQFQMQREMNNG